MKPTHCSDCDNVAADTRSKPVRFWQCVRFPNLAGCENPYVDPDYIEEPYNRCVRINRGHCPVWTRRRDGQTELPTNDC